ncbi:MAG: family 78 glycoside hydrolase catalytic domain [Verrucomicrobiales bacterium]|nr:family 78 glycoside hydrolase catalytic domain [Verrucomicrobiales bacterium]
MKRAEFRIHGQPLQTMVILAVMVMSLSVSAPGQSTSPLLRPYDLRCEGEKDPIGLEAPHPRLSWKLADDERGASQKAWQIQVFSDPPTAITDTSASIVALWDSGRVESAETAFHPYQGPDLVSSQKVHWRVRVWNDKDQPTPWSAIASWRMGILSTNDWTARWVQSGAPGMPVMRQEFAIAREVTDAVLHACGLGQFEVYLDGARIGDHFLDPPWSVYSSTIYYSTFELDGTALAPGRHVLSVSLGKGFYNTRGDRRIHGVNTDGNLQWLCQLELQLRDGSRQRVRSDSSWRTAPGFITHSAILGGEDHDARRLPPEWNRPGFDAGGWSNVIEAPTPKGRVRAMLSPPMKLGKMLVPRTIDEPQPGVFVYDFGINAAAVPRLRVRGHAGQRVRLIPAEQRQGMSPRRNDGHGLVNQAGVGTPNWFEYTLRGGPTEEWTPQFTYSGFQYLQVEGAVPSGFANSNGNPEIEDLWSMPVRSAVEDVGEFECSNPLFNAIDRIIRRAVDANLAHVLTDCPHREKLGWLEVSYLMGPSIAGRYDISRFYQKIIRDIADSQSPDGKVGTVAPAYPVFQGGFAYTPEWGAAAVVNPWLLYEWYGDLSALESNYPVMRGFVEYLRRTARDLVPLPGLGDWFDYGHGKGLGPAQFTSPELTAMATFHRCSDILSRAAACLGRNADAQEYRQLSDAIARAFNDRWLDGSAEYKNLGSPQTANSMALVSGLAPKERQGAVLNRIIDDLRARGNQQTAGDIGFWYLLRALADGGRSDVIYDLASRTNMGSYGFFVRNGWTSLPEAWDADTGASMNHCMLGHIQDWFMGWVAGIRPDLAGPGFRRFFIDPHPVGDVTWARATYRSMRGTIVVSWRQASGRFHLDTTIPPNTTATIHLPAARMESVTESGATLKLARGVRLRDANGSAPPLVLEVGGGTYHFEVRQQP